MEEEKIENMQGNILNNGQNKNQAQIAGAIIIAGVLIAGAILLKGGTPIKIDPVKQEAQLTKSMPIFSSCLDSGKYAQAVADARTEGGLAGVNGTPKGFILKNGKVVSMIEGAEDLTMVKQKIDTALTENNKTIGNIKLAPIVSSDFMLGSANAEVAIVLYEDFQCPFCGKFFKEVEKNIESTYVQNGTVKLVYRDFAFLGQESVKAAEAARCAGDQGKFWEYHDYLFSHQNGENQANFSSLNLKLFAKEVGLK